MAAAKWTAEQRAEALDLFRSHGPAEAARQTGIPKPTIASWARRLGVLTNAPVELEQQVASSSLAAEQRRLELADGLLSDVDRLRARLFAPLEYVHVKVLAAGPGVQEVERVHVELEQPVPADQLRLAQSIVALIEKAQLLTGEATFRNDETGGLDLEAELRQHQAATAEAAAIIRAQQTLHPSPPTGAPS